VECLLTVLRQLSQPGGGVAELPKPFWRRRWVKWATGASLLALAVAAGLVEIGLRRTEPFLRARIVEGIQNRFQARVELDSFHISLVDGLWAEGKGLRIWPPAQVAGVGVPAGQGEPLIRLAEFRFHTPLHYRPGQPIHVSVVQLIGLSIHLSPQSYFEHRSPNASQAPASQTPSQPKSAMAALVSFNVNSIECTGADLVMETSKPGKLPLQFAVAHLKLTNIASGGAMKYEADLTNPRPVGLIHATGSFGPWQTADPGKSPLTGDYRFDHADLASFKGVAGILSSTGHFEGTLRNLTVDGQTQTPDFRLTHFGHAMKLTTRFHAQVDGTNGDTWLQPVDATLGHSHFIAQGAVVRVLSTEAGDTTPHSIGHDIALAVNVDKARIEDFLHLASHSETVLMTGDVRVKTALHIPPAPEPVHERLKLNGWFALDKVRFNSAKMQGRIAELSLRGQGHPDEVKTTDPASILSQMQGSFQMASGTVTLPALEFTVPGAKIELKGAYGVEGGTLNFVGKAKLEASVSRIVGGWKGLLISPVDRYFKKDGAGTELPIHIEGTREQPEFGVDFNRMKLGEQQ